jgi:hypothetical protein
LPAESDNDQKIAQAIQEVSVKAQQLVREEIELAKAEVELKVKSLARGAVAGAIAGIFALAGLLFVLHGLAWFFYWLIPFPEGQIFWGFFVLAAILFLLAALGGFLAYRFMSKGSPPVPTLAIEEAQRIRATVESSTPESTL